MADVFISYKRRMRPRVEQLAEQLAALKLDVWFDAGLEPGVSFSREIAEKVRTAKAVLVCWTPDAFPRGGDQNGWITSEATIGRQRGALAAVFFEPCELDPPFTNDHAEDMTAWDGAVTDPAFRKLVGRIGRLCGRPGLGLYSASASPEEQQAWAKTFPDDPLAVLIRTRMIAEERQRLELEWAEEQRRLAALHLEKERAFSERLARLEPDAAPAAFPGAAPGSQSMPMLTPTPAAARPAPRKRWSVAAAAVVVCVGALFGGRQLLQSGTPAVTAPAPPPVIPTPDAIDLARQEDARKKAEADLEARRQADIAEARRKADEAEQARVRQQAEADAEARRQAEIAEAKRQAEIAEAKRQAEEAERTKARQQAEADAEARRQADIAAARQRAEEAEARQRADAEAASAAAAKARSDAAVAEAQQEMINAARLKEARAEADAQAKQQADIAEARRQADEAEKARMLRQAEAEAKQLADAEAASAAAAKERSDAAIAEAQQQMNNAVQLKNAKAKADADARKRRDLEAQEARKSEAAEAARRKAERKAAAARQQAEQPKPAAVKISRGASGCGGQTGDSLVLCCRNAARAKYRQPTADGAGYHPYVAYLPSQQACVSSGGQQLP